MKAIIAKDSSGSMNYKQIRLSLYPYYRFSCLHIAYNLSFRIFLYRENRNGYSNLFCT